MPLDWRRAEREVEQIAGNLPIYWGSGRPIYKPHVIATTKDALSGEGVGYNVYVYRTGAGYGKHPEIYSISAYDEEEGEDD